MEYSKIDSDWNPVAQTSTYFNVDEDGEMTTYLTVEEAKEIVDETSITFSWMADDDELVDTFFIQVCEDDDQGWFYTFMDLYKMSYPGTDVAFFDDVEIPMECVFEYQYGSENTQKLLDFLATVGANQEEYQPA